MREDVNENGEDIIISEAKEMGEAVAVLEQLLKNPKMQMGKAGDYETQFKTAAVVLKSLLLGGLDGIQIGKETFEGLTITEKQKKENRLRDITQCDEARMDAVVADPKNRENYGTFMYKTERGNYVACDNRTKEAWVEEFDDEETAIAWLNDEFEMSDYLEEMLGEEE